MPEYSISEKFKELVDALLQTFDTGGVKFLMDHDQQRDLSWKKEKKIASYAVILRTLLPVLLYLQVLGHT